MFTQLRYVSLVPKLCEWFVRTRTTAVKTNIIGKKRPINKDQMRDNVEAFMHQRKNDKKQVQKYFHAEHVRYAA
ncbi:hypothetical protein A9P82_13585 [Arachidicoccus ginsenosidimutans]|nr:hypothetical protein A9P82_13585 [Arachidicoccus sp. BS20]